MPQLLDKLINDFIDGQEDTREQGIKAIIELQAKIGVVESRQDAEYGWDHMSIQEQNDTLSAHQALLGHCPHATTLTFKCDDRDGAERLIKTLALPGYVYASHRKEGDNTIVRFKKV